MPDIRACKQLGGWGANAKARRGCKGAEGGKKRKDAKARKDAKGKAKAREWKEAICE